MLRSSAHFLHRNYTLEGKSAAIPTKLESLDQVLDFSLKLKSAGVNVDEMHAEIVKAGLVIAKDLTKLMERQSSITVNDEKIMPTVQEGGLQIAMQQRLLENNAAENKTDD